MRTLVWSTTFVRAFKRAARRQPELQARVKRTLQQLAEDPFHPTLRAGEAQRPARPEIPPELAELARQEITRHYETWPDTPLPALGGRTPRVAVRTEAGRREVTLLLWQMAYRLEPGEENVPEYDFNILRRALGLPEE